MERTRRTGFFVIEPTRESLRFYFLVRLPYARHVRSCPLQSDLISLVCRRVCYDIRANALAFAATRRAFVAKYLRERTSSPVHLQPSQMNHFRLKFSGCLLYLLGPRCTVDYLTDALAAS